MREKIGSLIYALKKFKGSIRDESKTAGESGKRRGEDEGDGKGQNGKRRRVKVKLKL